MAPKFRVMNFEAFKVRVLVHVILTPPNVWVEMEAFCNPNLEARYTSLVINR